MFGILVGFMIQLLMKSGRGGGGGGGGRKDVLGSV